MNETIYSFLKDIFSDDDGHLYPRGTDGVEKFNQISRMSPAAVRSFIRPSIPTLPDKSLIILPIRFGFSNPTPATWRNKSSRTKEILERNDTTVSISNSSSTSGKLVIAGYVLLKAPMTTHRIRYLQALRRTLAESTPPFHILLHKRTPLDQQMNHLAVQCGKNHVHALSQFLPAALAVNGSLVYIPRFAFADMTVEQATKLFDAHDTFIKKLKSIPLFKFLTNLDRG